MSFTTKLGVMLAFASACLMTSATAVTADTIVSANTVNVAGCNACASPGSIPIIQVEGAVGGAVQGANAAKPARSGQRTVYYWQPDITAGNDFPSYGISFGSSWAVVFHDSGNLVIDPSVSASVTLGALQDTGLTDGLGNAIQKQPVLVNNLPVYQYWRDSQSSSSDPNALPVAPLDPTGVTNVTGIYGTWYGVGANGAVVIPEPSTALLVGSGLGLLSWRRRQS